MGKSNKAIIVLGLAIFAIVGILMMVGLGDRETVINILGDGQGSEVFINSGLPTIWGTESNVTLESPANDSTVDVALVSFNAFANVTQGQGILNMSLYNNVTGVWARRNTTTFFPTSDESFANALGDVTGAETGYSGMKIVMKGNYTVKNITKKAGDNSVNASILNSDGSINVSASFIGDTGTFDTQLVQGVTYYVVGGGTTVTHRFTSRSFPYNNSYFNITAGMFNSADSSAQARTIDSIYLVPSNRTNQTFNDTLNGSIIIWNFEACDTENSCGFAEDNFTINLESVAPIINLSAPTNKTFGAVGELETLEWNVTDSNLDECWYNYNETNVSVTCNVNTTTFTLLTNNTNLTFYANDTAGNLHSNFTDWNYTITQEEINFINETTEGNVAPFYYIINTSSGLVASSSNFFYNGTSESATVVLLGGNTYNISVQKLIPTLTADANLSFFMQIILNNSVQANTTATNQTVINIGVDDCGVFTTRILNYTVESSQKGI